MTTPPDSHAPIGPIAAHSVVRALVDTNVAIDLILARQPWLAAAQPLWDTRDAGLVAVYLSASVVTDIFYIVRRQADIATAFSAIDQVFGAFGLLSIDAPLLHQARGLPGNDFEDNVQIACAMSAQLDVIVTRNLTDFRFSPVPAIEPSQITLYLPKP